LHSLSHNSRNPNIGSCINGHLHYRGNLRIWEHPPWRNRSGSVNGLFEDGECTFDKTLAGMRRIERVIVQRSRRVSDTTYKSLKQVKQRENRLAEIRGDYTIFSGESTTKLGYELRCKGAVAEVAQSYEAYSATQPPLPSHQSPCTS
jgi:hypothetical protein